jgi:LCP family protein required for cell wall assembly
MVIVLFVVGIAGYAWYLNSEINRVDVKGLVGGGVGAEAASENILLIGSTSRCALKVQNPAYGLCSQNAAVNSDVVMIVHLGTGANKVTLLSIPRDTFVPNARAEGANKIDAGLAEGPSQLVASIEENFGIPIQHFVELNFDTFANIVNALGGVRMYFPMPVYDHYSGLDVTTPGCHTLNGVQALQVVRAQHLQYQGPGVTSTDPATWPQEMESDLARIRRDHEFLRVIVSAMAHKGLGNPATDLQLVSSVAPQLEVDSGFSMTDIADLLVTLHGVNPNKAPQVTIPISTSTFGSYIYQGGDYGDVVFPTEPEDQNAIDSFLGVTPATDTMTGRALPQPAAVSVEVLNGTGVPNQAADTATSLGGLGFHVTGTGDSPSVSTQAAETVAYYAGPAEHAAAETVARSLSGFVITSEDAAMASPGSQVTLVTGSDFTVNAGAVAPTTSTPPTSTTSTPVSSSTASANSTPAGFQAPSASVQGLAPWDPRACTASGGEGT